MSTVTRRDFLQRAALLSAGVAVGGPALAACSSGSGGSGGGGGAETLTFTSYGGAYQTAQQKAFVQPFMEANPNVTIVEDSPTDYGKLAAMVKSNNVTWDLVDVGDDFGLSATTKYLESIDCKTVHCDQLQPDLYPTTGYRVPAIGYGVVMAYNKEKLPKAPQSFADFFNVKDFPGGRGLYDQVSNGVLEAALLADGVKAADLYPLDADRAFKKLDTIKGNIVYWSTGAQSAQILSNGQATVGMSWNGRIYDIQQAGAPVEIQWNEYLMTADYLVITKGSEHTKTAMKLAAYMTSAEHSAQITKYIPYDPPNAKSLDKVDKKMAPHLPSSHTDGQIPFNSKWWDKHRSELQVRYEQWRAS